MAITFQVSRLERSVKWKNALRRYTLQCYWCYEGVGVNFPEIKRYLTLGMILKLVRATLIVLLLLQRIVVRLAVRNPTEGGHVRQHTAVCERIPLPEDVSNCCRFLVSTICQFGRHC